MDGSRWGNHNGKSRITRIPINKKFVPNSDDLEKSTDDDFVPSTRDFVGANIGNFESDEQNFIKFSPETSDDAQDKQTKDDFESVWQMLAIVLSIAIMMVIFAIIVVQGMVFNKRVWFTQREKNLSHI